MLGIVTGLTPGLHVNTVGLIIFSVSDKKSNRMSGKTPFSEAETVLEEVDCILLGPQVRFQKTAIEKMAKARKAGPIPVAVIDMRDYGTMNGKAVYTTALNLFK